MAQVVKRTWRVGPKRVKRVAWGYTLQVNGKQVRKFNSEWATADDAQKALSAVLLGLEPVKAKGTGMTLGEAVARYLLAKSRKRSLASDKTFLNWFKEYFGAETPLTQITAARIAAWKGERLAATCPQTKRPYSAAAVNRPLAALSHLLRLAHEEWEALPAVPKIKLEKEAEGRLRWLEPDEEARLLEVCRTSRNPQLAHIVVMALNTGLRLSELLGLTWDRVDLSRGVIRLEITKSGKRREVPMRQVVYEILAGMPEPREGRVFLARSIRTAFENAVEAAKLDNFHFHDTRHSFASWFVMRGGSPQTLKEILGHADLKMTLRYAHLAPDHLRSEMTQTERLGDFSTTSAQSTPEGVFVPAK